MGPTVLMFHFWISFLGFPHGTYWVWKCTVFVCRHWTATDPCKQTETWTRYTSTLAIKHLLQCGKNAFSGASTWKSFLLKQKTNWTFLPCWMVQWIERCFSHLGTQNLSTRRHGRQVPSILFILNTQFHAWHSIREDFLKSTIGKDWRGIRTVIFAHEIQHIHVQSQLNGMALSFNIVPYFITPGVVPRTNDGWLIWG